MVLLHCARVRPFPLSQGARLGEPRLAIKLPVIGCFPVRNTMPVGVLSCSEMVAEDWPVRTARREKDASILLRKIKVLDRGFCDNAASA